MKMKNKNIEKIISCAFLLSVCALFSGCAKKTADVSPSDLKPIETESEVSLGGETSKESADTEENVSVPEGKAPEKPASDLPLSETVNTFNWEFYDLQDTGSNVFFSPMSLESALAMVLSGAKNDTFDELAGVLHIANPDTFMDGYSRLSGGYDTDGAKLTIANSLWIDESFEKEHGIEPSFISKLEEKMDAEVIPEDFKNDPQKASLDISEWVSDKTENLIPDYQSVSDSNTVLDIINAIYFYGEWKYKFDANDTFDMDFRTSGGNRTVDMMNMHDEYYRYLDEKGFKGIELPYAGDAAVMDIIMSEDDSDLSSPDAFKSLSAEEREEFLSKLSSADETKISALRLPKFTMDLSAEGLKEKLQKMGIRSAFDPEKADLSGICEKLFISDIAHRAKIEVDEEGSRAAAVTEVTMRVTGAMIDDEERIEFVCDRPFVFVIRDASSGTILFTGAVNEP